MAFDDEWKNAFVNNQPGLKQREQNAFGFS